MIYDPQKSRNMTLEEKCALLSGGGQFTTKAIPRLGIQPLYLSDGPLGVRRQAGAADHLGLNPSLPATCYPAPAAMANAWDLDLEEELGRYLGAEAVALRVNVLLGPGLNLKRSPLCGRNFEYFSEDPYLSGKLAAACIRGIQSQGVAACPKHLAANSQETLRMHSDSVVDPRTLRELYLTGFEIAVREGNPKCIMTSYNRLNGTYTNEDRHLLRDILVEEWGFRGFVVTDWGGSNDHAAGVAAGSHLEMPAAGPATDRELIEAVRAGRVKEDWIDRMVAELLGVADTISIPADAPTEFDKAAHHAFARRAAAETVVLLKNQGELLPLAPGARVAVIGDFADRPRFQGSGSSCVNPTQVDRPLDELKAAGLEITGYAPGYRRYGGEDAALQQEAVQLAREAEIVLLYLGLDELAETEGMDRAHLSLRGEQNQLAAAVCQANPNVIVVLSGGAPMELPWLEHCPALLYGSLGGQAGAGAMADVLTGKVNPSGKLAESWPMKLADTPCAPWYPGRESSAQYREGPFVGYRYYQTAHIPVQFPFGFGLSYTAFQYSELEADAGQVTFTLTNTGRRTGAEVAQLYISRADSGILRPALELKGFAKVQLAPGESRRVTIPLDRYAFRFFSRKTGKWETEGGAYQIHVGPSSASLLLSAQVSVAGTPGAAPEDLDKLPHYRDGAVNGVTEAEFSALLGRPAPPLQWDRTAPLSENDTFSQLCYASGRIGRLVHHVLKRRVEKGEKTGTPDLNALFCYSMPFRAVAKMTAGAVDLAMVRALVEIFNDSFRQGVSHLWHAWRHKRRLDRKGGGAA